MSHIAKVETKLSDLEALKDACQELGLELEQDEGMTVRDYYGNSALVAARISLGQYALGFQRGSDEILTMVADFWGIAKYADAPRVRAACQGISGSIDEISRQAQERLSQLITRSYNVAVVRRQLAQNPAYKSFSFAEERNEAGDVVRLVATRRRY